MPCPGLVRPVRAARWVERSVASGSLCVPAPPCSGTTGNPKGVLYSHRAQFLHALLLVQSDSVPLTSSSTCLAIVPMFHANVWGELRQPVLSHS